MDPKVDKSLDLETALDIIMAKYQEPKERKRKRKGGTRVPKARYKAIVKWLEKHIQRNLTVPEICYIMHQCLIKRSKEVKERVKKLLPKENKKPVFTYYREIEGLGRVPLFFVILPRNHRDYRIALRDLFISGYSIKSTLPRLALCPFCKDPTCFLYNRQWKGADEVWSYKCERRICRIAPHEQVWDPLEQYIDSLGREGAVITRVVVDPFSL